LKYASVEADETRPRSEHVRTRDRRRSLSLRGERGSRWPHLGAFLHGFATGLRAGGAQAKRRLGAESRGPAVTRPRRQDQALAQDTYCVVTTDGTTYYGGVREWRIAASTLSVTLDEAATQVLGVDGSRIMVPDAERATVQAALRELLMT
jgi:hypothetical protein